MITNQDLSELVVLAQKGEPYALRKLIECTQTDLFRFTLFLTRNRPLAEDIMQETYLKVLTKISQLTDPKKFRPWLFQIARSTHIDTIRKDKEESQDQQLAQNQAERKNHIQDLSSFDMKVDLSVDVNRALDKIAPEDKDLLMLIDLAGLSYSEAGEVLGLSEDSIRMKIHRARVSFRENYKNSETIPLKKTSLS
jgi:RNA polymerase sigma-70 factor, ECF subfamily